MFNAEPSRPKARKWHRCTSCGESIEIGVEYVRWLSVDGREAMHNKMHPECYSAHNDDATGEWEYMLYGHPRGSSAEPAERRHSE